MTNFYSLLDSLEGSDTGLKGVSQKLRENESFENMLFSIDFQLFVITIFHFFREQLFGVIHAITP
jgi:hypothetical protein